MTRSLILSTTLLALMVPSVSQARARRPVKRKPKPKLLLTVERVEAKTPMPRILPAVRDALDKALASEPLVITKLGLKKPTKARTAWALRRRRLKWYGVSVRLESATYKVISGNKSKLLVAVAEVSLSGTRRARRKKGSFSARGMATVSTPVSVVLQGEVLASRVAAARAAVADALKIALTKLIAPKKRGR